MIHMMEKKLFFAASNESCKSGNPVQLPSQFADRIGLRWLCRFTI
jgi:hypothetical protein